MTLSSSGQFTLKVRLGMRLLTPIQILVIFLWIAGIGAWLWCIPYLKNLNSQYQSQYQQLETKLNHLPASIGPETLTPSEQHLQYFYAILGESRYAEQQVATLIALANKNGLNIGETDYQIAENKNGNFRTYTVMIPIKGQYGMIRSFCDQILLTIPFAALDELNFKRASISNQIIETRVRFTLYLDDPEGIEGRTFVTLHKLGSEE